MAITLLAPAILAAAAAIALAPAAMADDADDAADVADSATSQQANNDDRDKGVSASGPARKPAGPARTPGSPKVQDVPQGWLNDALWSDQAGGKSNPFGSLPKPPVFALD